MLIIEILYLFFLIDTSTSQSTSDCGVNYRCFVSPNGCSNTACTFIYKWKSNGVNFTDFIISGKIGRISSHWLAIGFSTDQLMGRDDVVICRTPNNLVQHYVNPVYATPVLMNPTVPSIGLSNSLVNINNDWLTCSFTRMVSMPSQQNYYDLTNQYYILAAYGMLSAGNIQYHSNRLSSLSTFSYQFTPIQPTTTSTIIPSTTGTSTQTTTKGTSSNVTLAVTIKSTTTVSSTQSIFQTLLQALQALFGQGH